MGTERFARTYRLLAAAFFAASLAGAQTGAPATPPAGGQPAAPQVRMRWQDFVSGTDGAKRLASLQTRAMNFQPYSPRADARRMPDDLAEDLVRTINELREQTNALAAHKEEETQLRAQFQSDIERYRELHTIHSQ